MTTHYLDGSKMHNFWDNSLPPRIRINPGDTVVFETVDASVNQITPQSTHEDIGRLDFGRVNAVTGPVYVEGAEPGDGLVVEVLRLKHRGWGWSAVIPGLGLLADEFPDPYLHHYKLGPEFCVFREDILIPCEPFCGEMGVAPQDPGRFGAIPPRANGGNLDTRHLGVGTKVIFPVFIPGALFSCGDCHAAQGDGEINGTGIESSMTVTLRFSLLKGANLSEMRFITAPGKKLTSADGGGYYVTTAHGPDLFKDAQQAVRYMIDHLTSACYLTREQAYCLCGAAVDLKISQVVDSPNFMVSAYFPLGIFVTPGSKAATKPKAGAKPKPKAKPGPKPKAKSKPKTRAKSKAPKTRH
jgi:acetamidase/formamidase